MIARCLFLLVLVATSAWSASTDRRWHRLEAEPDSALVGFGVEAEGDDPDPALLVYRCRSGEIEFFVIADTSDVAPWPTHAVNVFVGTLPALYETWNGSTDGGALFASQPQRLASLLLKQHAETLELGIHGRGGRTRTLRFDVRGFDEPYRVIFGACPPPQPTPSTGSPAFGEYVHVEELPEAISKVPPVYPAEARAQRMEGTVVVQALVGKDGLVKNTKVVKSVPVLDPAAEAAVRRWRFKPARARGEPVEVWVAVPVKFSLD